ncbi:hypothetical protein EMPS_00271 [Entomortierella parvispora]|uniref:HMG box domain-containing protein n=1 Tax=Entomortierella parvispora TaxID=205924 RepID=A0A9P3H0F7_9FUNG|nr:hypothetical protein EMPS_00271 [Entomortierella parvispora]
MASPLVSSAVFFPPTASALHQKRRKAKKHALRVPRPKNCFMLYRTHVMPMIMVELGNLNNRVISQIAAERWNAESEPVKAWYRLMAKMGKEEHAINHPGYRYAPNKKLLDYSSQEPYRDDGEDNEAGVPCRTIGYSELKDMISDDDDDNDPTYRSRKSTKKYMSARKGVLNSRRQNDSRLSIAFSQKPNVRGRRKIAGKDLGPSHAPADPDFQSVQSPIDASTLLGPQAIVEPGGGMYSSTYYHVGYDHGSTLTSLNPIEDYRIVADPQQLYPLQAQCCRVLQHQAFQQLESQPPHLHHDALLDSCRNFHILPGGEHDLHLLHQQRYHENCQDWNPPFYLHSSRRHSFYDVNPEANASVETLVDPSDHWLTHRYYDSMTEYPGHFDSELSEEKDVPSLPMDIVVDAVHDPHSTLAQLSSVIYGVGQNEDKSKVAMTSSSHFTRVGQEGHSIKYDIDKAQPPIDGTTDQQFFIQPASLTYLSFTEASHCESATK